MFDETGAVQALNSAIQVDDFVDGIHARETTVFGPVVFRNLLLVDQLTPSEGRQVDCDILSHIWCVCQLALDHWGLRWLVNQAQGAMLFRP